MPQIDKKMHVRMMYIDPLSTLQPISTLAPMILAISGDLTGKFLSARLASTLKVLIPFVLDQLLHILHRFLADSIQIALGFYGPD